MTITIKKGQEGYHVVGVAEHPPLYMKYNKLGMVCPLNPYAVLYVEDVRGNRLKFIGDRENKLEKISLEGPNGERQEVLECELDPENGVWFFLSSRKVVKGSSPH